MNEDGIDSGIQLGPAISWLSIPIEACLSLKKLKISFLKGFSTYSHLFFLEID
jgi:hypothetical protein